MPALALGLLLGCWSQLQQAALSGPVADALLFGLAVAAGVAAVRLRHRRGAVAALVLLLGFTLGWADADWRSAARLRERLPHARSGRVQVVDGVVADLPARSADGWRVAFAPLDPSVPRLQLNWSRGVGASAPPSLWPGQRWRLALKLKAVHGSANPYGFDTELRALERGIGASASVSHSRAQPAPQLLGCCDGYRLARLRASLRARIERALGAAPAAGTVVALALGDQAAIAPDGWALYRSTGIAHLVSISGLHITLLAALAGSAAGWVWRRLRCGRWRASLLLATPDLVQLARVLAAAAYALLAGLGVPAQRALLMLVAGALMRWRGLAPAWWQGLSWALILVLLWDPWAVLAAGFWLSFGAVAMLFVADAAAARRPPAALPRWRRAASGLRAAAQAQLGLSLALAPATLLWFQQVAWVGPLANALAIPWVTLWVVPLDLVGLLLPTPLADACWRAAAASLQLLHAVLGALAAWPQPPWRPAAPGALAMLLAAAGSVALALNWGWRLRLGGLLLLLPAFATPARGPPLGHVQAWIADVGQGSAVLVRTARHALLADAGPASSPGNDAGTRVLVPLLRAIGVQRLDLLLLSHPDHDHVGGAAAVMQAWHPPLLGSVPASLVRALGAHASTRCAAGQRWSWDGVDFAVLHPPAPDDGSRRSNAASCVLRVSSRHGSLLLSGDLPRAQERALVRAGALPPTDLLLVGHHGSATSSSADALRALRPSLAAIQVGYASAYGHPHPQVLQRLQAVGAAIYRSDRDGALWWRDTQPDRLCAWRASHRRYWQLDWRPQPPETALSTCRENWE